MACSNDSVASEDEELIFTQEEIDSVLTQFKPPDFTQVINESSSERVVRLLFRGIGLIDERVKHLRRDTNKLSKELTAARGDIKKILEIVSEGSNFLPEDASQSLLSTGQNCDFTNGIQSNQCEFITVSWNGKDHAMMVDKHTLLVLQTTRTERSLVREMLLALHDVEYLKSCSLTGKRSKRKRSITESSIDQNTESSVINQSTESLDSQLVSQKHVFDTSVQETIDELNSALPPLTLAFINGAVERAFPLRGDADDKEKRNYSANVRRTISASLQYIKQSN